GRSTVEVDDGQEIGRAMRLIARPHVQGRRFGAMLAVEILPRKNMARGCGRADSGRRDGGRSIAMHDAPRDGSQRDTGETNPSMPAHERPPEWKWVQDSIHERDVLPRDWTSAKGAA